MLDTIRHLLSAPERKASRTARLIAIESGGRARWTPRDYAALAREGYMRNAIVHRAVRLIAESVAGSAFVLVEDDKELAAHPLLDLMARPNPRQDGPAFLESIAAHLMYNRFYRELIAVREDSKRGRAISDASWCRYSHTRIPRSG